jgi:hypothetical protein
MWNIIKAELAYLKVKLFPASLVLVGLSVLYILEDKQILSRLTFLLAAFVVAKLIGAGKAEKRKYWHTVLPISLFQLAAARLWLSILPVFAIYTSAILFNLFIYGYQAQYNDSIFELLSLGLVTILISFVYFFLDDIFCVFRTKNGQIIFHMILSIIMGIGTLATIITVERTFAGSVESGLILLAFLVVSIILFAVFTLYTNNQRESHIY